MKNAFYVNFFVKGYLQILRNNIMFSFNIILLFTVFYCSIECIISLVFRLPDLYGTTLSLDMTSLPPTCFI